MQTGRVGGKLKPGPHTRHTNIYNSVLLLPTLLLSLPFSSHILLKCILMFFSLGFCVIGADFCACASYSERADGQDTGRILGDDERRESMEEQEIKR